MALGVARGPYLADLRSDVVVHELGAEHARAAVPAVVKTVWKVRPQVVLSTLGMNLALALARPLLPRSTRVILREGNSASAFLDEVRRESPVRAIVYRWSYRSLYRLADKVVCQSEFMMKDIASCLGLPIDRMTRIYNPVDTERVRSLSHDEVPAYVGPGPHLVTVGKLAYQKGYDVLLRALVLVRQGYPTATLTIVGDGADRHTLEELAWQLELADAVRFLGFVKNPYPYVARADLFVSSSRYEGFANVILEALACGTPVVATDCPSGNREILEEGITGWFARVDDPGSLADAICAGMRARTQLDAAVVRDRCESMCSVQRIVGEYERLFSAAA
jgi:glycosyltransferase involved in cell wall biosynthesis